MCAMLWDAGVKAEMPYKANPKMLTQFQYCERELVPLQVVIGEDEKSKGCVKLRVTETKEEVGICRGTYVLMFIQCQEYLQLLIYFVFWIFPEQTIVRSICKSFTPKMGKDAYFSGICICMRGCCGSL